MQTTSFQLEMEQETFPHKQMRHSLHYRGSENAGCESVVDALVVNL